MAKEKISELLEKKLSSGREYRDMEMRALGSDDPDEMIVEGYATTFNQAYRLWEEPGYTVDEMIDARAFDGCDMSDVIMQYDHEGRVFARMSNGTLTAVPDEHGLLTRAILGGTEIGKQLYQEIKGGYTTKMSFAFRVAEDRREIEEDKKTGEMHILRIITKIARLFDVSAVSLPANPATNISARNYGEGVVAEVKEEILAAEAQRSAAQAIKARIRIMAEQ